MTTTTLLVALVGCGLCASLTLLVLRVARRLRLMDVPNARSSHQSPTPRVGGIAILLATGATLLALWALRQLPPDLPRVMLIGGGVIAVCGLLDDVYSLNPALRLLVHALVALLTVLAVGGMAPIRVGGQFLTLGPWGLVLGVLTIVWSINLFNFMDGIDGIAAAEACFMAAGAAALWLTEPGHAGRSDSASTIALCFAAVCFGFLVWNWAPARIFMGDVGSGFLGYVIAALAVAQGHSWSVATWVWLTLGMVFFADATVTLLRRLFRGERVYQAHRSHAYQWLARRWRSHARSTLAALLIDLLWLLPCALLERQFPAMAAWITLIAAAPVVIWVLIAGAGRAEHLPATQ